MTEAGEPNEWQKCGCGEVKVSGTNGTAAFQIRTYVIGWFSRAICGWPGRLCVRVAQRQEAAKVFSARWVPLLLLRDPGAKPSGPVRLQVCLGQRGVSPLQARALRPVTEGNCVAVRRGGKQPEVHDQSATQVNSIRPCGVASPLARGEARTAAIRKSATLMGSVIKRS